MAESPLPVLAHNYVDRVNKLKTLEKMLLAVVHQIID